MDLAADFFRFARERHRIYLKREAGDPWPWTEDPVLRTGRFTNVFRELDRTTAWFREQPEVLLATVIFRWFNRTTTGEALFLQRDLFGGRTAFEQFSADLSELRLNSDTLGSAIRHYCGEKGPFITGAYTINTRSAGLGLTKLAGVLTLIEMWVGLHQDWRERAADWADPLNSYQSMEEFCAWAASPCLAGFMTYELACDLRWTALLEKAQDVDTWANVGPGAVRGLNRISCRPASKGLRQGAALDEMRELLRMSRNGRYWPSKPQDRWPVWGLREVEHTLCEYDKYERVRAGEGKTRGNFKWPH
jgi:hypothetical protein